MELVLSFLLCIGVVLCQEFPPGGNFGGGRQEWYCHRLENEDCMDHALDQRCGTDDITYYNMCDLGQAHCNNTDIHQQKVGACSPSEVLTTPSHGHSNLTGSPDLVDKTTTPVPEELVHGSEVILDFQCVMLSHSECTHVINEQICGTDGRTYDTFCEYEKARCTHRDLHVAGTGPCKS